MSRGIHRGRARSTRGTPEHRFESTPVDPLSVSYVDPSSAPASPSESHAGHRHARLSQILYEELDAVIRDEIHDPALEDVKFTSVELSVDYRSARVRFLPASLATDPAGATAARAFERAAPFLRARLTEALEVKHAPALRFVFDRDAANADTALATLASGGASDLDSDADEPHGTSPTEPTPRARPAPRTPEDES